jgi:uncharacterized protein YqjF (DUF2071 family)
MDRNLTHITTNLLVATAGRAIIINSMTNEFAGKTIKTHRWRKWTNNANKHNKTITAINNSRPTIGTIITSARIAITIAITTKTNEQEMIAVDQTHKIAPTPKCAVRAAQVVITTETVHTSAMRKRSTRKQTTHNELNAEPHTKTKISVHTR